MFVRLEERYRPETGPRKYYPDNIITSLFHYKFVGTMRSRYRSGLLILLFVYLMMIPSVTADSVFQYAVSSDDRIYYHWTGNRTRDSCTVELDHIVYIAFIYGVPDNVSFPFFLTHYALYFDNGTPIGYNVPGWLYNGTRPGVELVEPVGFPLAPLPIGNWTAISLAYSEFNVTEDLFTWTLSMRYYQATYSKSDGVVSHLIYTKGNPENYSYYYELTRIIDWTPSAVISIIGISGVICVVFIFRKRRVKSAANSNKEL